MQFSFPFLEAGGTGTLPSLVCALRFVLSSPSGWFSPCLECVRTPPSHSSCFCFLDPHVHLLDVGPAGLLFITLPGPSLETLSGQQTGAFEELISRVLHLPGITGFHRLKFQVLKTTVVSILPNFSLVSGVCVEGRRRNPVSITPFGVEAEVETSHYMKINTL